MFTGGLLPVIGRYSPLYTTAGVFVIIAGSLMHTIDINTSTNAIYGYEVLLAIGTGAAMQIAYAISVAKVKQHDVQNAIGFINVAQIGTLAVSLSIAGSVFQNRGFINLREALDGYGFSEQELRGALSGAQSAVLNGSGGLVKEMAIMAIVRTLDSVWILMMVAGAVSLIAGLLMGWERLNLQAAGI